MAGRPKKTTPARKKPTKKPKVDEPGLPAVGSRAEEVVVRDDRRAARAWAPTKAQPASLVVDVIPDVVDVFTSSKGSSQPERVFFVGESLQWNIIHYVNPLFKHVEYDASLHLTHLGIGYHVELGGPDIETVFPVECWLTARRKYQWAGTWDQWWLDKVPVSPARGRPVTLPVSSFPPTAAQSMSRIAAGTDMLVTPGIWRATAIVEIVSNLAPRYDLQSTWHYKIVGNPRSPD